MKTLARFALVGALLVNVISLLSPRVQAAGPQGDSQADQTWDYVRVVGIANNQSSLDVEVAPFNNCQPSGDTTPSKTCQQLHLIVKDAIVEDRVKQLHIGDRIKITFAFGQNNQNSLKQFCLDTAPPPSRLARVAVFLVAGLICFLFYYLGSGLHPSRLIIGEDNRYSNSKFQIAAWFAVLITTYIATLWMRVWYAGCDFMGGVDIPRNLLLITGISGLTFGGAMGITTSKVADAQDNDVPDPKNAANVTGPHFLRDLMHNDGKAAAPGSPGTPQRLDFGDFQMLVVTLIAITTYLVLVFNFLGTIETARVVSLPDLDTTILAAFGLGHGAYLTKKAVGNVGQS